MVYNNVEFDREISEETIISNLLELQQRLVNEFSDSKQNKLTAGCYKHSKVEQRKEEDGRSEDAFLIVVCIFIVVFLFLLLYCFSISSN